MLEKITDFVIFFFISDAIFGAAIFVAYYNFLRPLSKRFAFILYLIMTVLILFASVHISFFVDSYDPNCKKLYRNKILYTIDLGETKSLEQIMGHNVRCYSYYMTDGNTGKKIDTVLCLRINLGPCAYEKIELDLNKKEIINIDESIFEVNYKMTSNIAITREGEKAFSIKLINLENASFDYEEDDEVKKSLKAKLELLQKESESPEW